jgi:hypothetical protein
MIFRALFATGHLLKATILINEIKSINLKIKNAANTENEREKIQALSLSKECYSMKLELLTNAAVVDDAIRFVSQKPKKLKSSDNVIEDDNEEPNELDYNEDKAQLDEKQEEQRGEIAATNQVF